MIKRTNGEWRVVTGKTYCAVRSDDRVVADIRTINGCYNEKDANLIAAAPDMYKIISELYLNSGLVYGEDYDKIEELLTKARGE